MATGEVSYREVDAKTVTRVPGTTDAWFVARYGMNLYRGCEHGCVYCDGRAERYYVVGDFARDITVKRNAVEVLDRELARIREPGYVFLGGGVCDAYQPAEARYRLARGVLESALRHALPVHVLTKSALVERDLDLLERVDASRRAILSFSIQTVDEAVRERFEPGAAPLADRWRLLAEAKRRGLAVGLMAMPVLPGISDQPPHIDALVARAADVGVDFLCFGGLTLRRGVQHDSCLAVIRRHHPDLIDGYARAYRVPRRSGAPDPRYLDRVDARFREALARHGIPGRIPRRLFSGLVPAYVEAAVLLEHRAFERRPGDPPPATLRAAGTAIQRWARERLARARRRSFTWRSLEDEFHAMLRDGTLADLPGLDGATPAVVRELAG